MRKDTKDMFVPEYWKGNVKDVDNAVKEVKKGKVTRLLDSAGNRPIYLFEYGRSSIEPPKVSMSSAYGARNFGFFADKTKDDYIPTVLFVGCMHGGEWEGTVALLNLIKLLETGTDYKGEGHDDLLSAAEGLHILIIPIANPDGRARIPFDNFVGKTFEDLRYYNQGTWLDGTLCGWPECMKLSPIKEYCDFLGGYFNDDGVNMYNDDFFLNPSHETLNVLRVARNNVPDMTVLFHGGDNTVGGFLATKYSTRAAFDAVKSYSLDVKAAFEKCGIKYNMASAGFGEPESQSPPQTFGFPSAVHHTCGEPCAIYESNQGLCDKGNYILNNDQIYTSHLLIFKTTFDWVRKSGSTATKFNKKQ